MVIDISTCYLVTTKFIHLIKVGLLQYCDSSGKVRLCEKIEQRLDGINEKQLCDREVTGEERKTKYYKSTKDEVNSSEDKDVGGR